LYFIAKLFDKLLTKTSRTTCKM